MAVKNKNGNRRGMDPGSRDGLIKARKARREGPSRGVNGMVQKPTLPVSEPKQAFAFAKLIHGSKEQLHPRIREFVTQCEDEPGIVVATILGTLMADLNDANDVIGNTWTWIKTYMKDPESDPRSLTKLLGELRKWTDSMKEAAVKVAELQMKGLTPPEESTNPLGKYEVSDEEEEEEELVLTDEPSVLVSFDDAIVAEEENLND